MRSELIIGSTCGGLYIILNRFTNAAPDLVLGALLGFGICFGVIGLLPDTIYNKLKKWEKGNHLPFLKWKPEVTGRYGSS